MWGYSPDFCARVHTVNVDPVSSFNIEMKQDLTACSPSEQELVNIVKQSFESNSLTVHKAQNLLELLLAKDH
jgi:hypothetical protein